MNNGRLKISVHVIIGEVVLREPDVHGNEGPDHASEDHGPVEDDGSGDHQAHIGEVPGVINTKEPTRDLVLDTDRVLQRESFGAGRTIVRSVPITSITGLGERK